MLEFGIVTMVSFPVLIVVVLRPMPITSPSTSSTMIQSPTLKGRSTIIEIAPNMLATESFAAKASVRPVILRPDHPIQVQSDQPCKDESTHYHHGKPPYCLGDASQRFLAAMLSLTTMNASR